MPNHFQKNIQNIKGYNPKEGTFESVQNSVKESFIKKNMKEFKDTEVIPLPQYFIDKDIFEQSSEFEEGFKIFAQHLINHIEESRNKIVLDAESACNTFDLLVKTTEEQNLTELAAQAVEEWKRSGFDRLYTPVVESIINEKIIDIQTLINNTELDLQKMQYVKKLDINIDDICAETIDLLETRIPKFVQNEEIFTKFKSMVNEQIGSKCTVFADLIQKIKDKQIQFIQIKVRSIINKKEKLILDEIHKSKLVDENEMIESSQFNTIKKDCKKIVKNIMRSDEFYDDIQDQIQQYIKEEIDAVYKTIQSHAENKSNENYSNQKKSIKKEINEIIEIETNDIKDAIADMTLEQFSTIDTKKLYNEILEKCKSSFEQYCDQNNINEKLKIFGESYILKTLTNYKNDVNSYYKQTVKEKTDNLLSKIITEINKIITTQKIELMEIIYGSSSTEFSEINKKAQEKLNRINKECENKINELIKANKTSSPKIKSESSDYAKSQIDKLNIDILQDIKGAAQGNVESQKNILRGKVDSIIQREIQYYKSKIESSSSLSNSIPERLYDEIQTKCQNEINFYSISNGTIKGEIEAHIANVLPLKIKEINEAIKGKIDENIQKKINSLKATIVDGTLCKYKERISTKIQSSTSPNFSQVYPSDLINQMRTTIDQELKKDSGYNTNSYIQTTVNTYKTNQINNITEDAISQSKERAKENKSKCIIA